jgi:hypothetical protein
MNVVFKNLALLLKEVLQRFLQGCHMPPSC